ncbi:hypothetical protein QQ73_11995 [Candidatus Endoriftia persephone str. Guaymas]|nr:hypothetical protein [Candidatus Endoriftia persephone str. Guaymas]
MGQIPSLFPIPTGSSLQPVGDEIAQWAGIAAAGNTAIEAAFSLALQVFCGQNLFCLIPVAQAHCRRPVCRFCPGCWDLGFSFEKMAGILPQIRPEQVAYIANL